MFKQKKVIIDSIFLYISNLLIKSKGLIFLPLIISAVGLKNYGIFIQILINPTFIAPLCTLVLFSGFNRYTSRYSKKDIILISKDFYTIFFVTLMFSFMGSMVLYLVSPFISKMLFKGEGLNSLRLSSLMVISNAVWQQLSTFLQARKRFNLYSLFFIFYELIPYLGFVSGIMIKNSIFTGLLFYILIQYLILLIIFIKVSRNLTVSLPSFSIFKKFLSYSWPLIFSRMEGSILAKVDRYFIGYFIGPKAIGIYNIVNSIVSLISTISLPFDRYNLNYLPKYWDNGETGLVKEKIKEGLIYFLTISCGLLIGLVFYLKPVLKLILFKDLYNIPFFELLTFVLGLSLIFDGITKFSFLIYKCKEENYKILLYKLMGIIVNIVFNTILIPILGIFGAGLATLFSSVIIVVISSFEVKLDNKIYINFLKIIMACMPMGVIAYIVNLNNIFLLGISILISGVFYLTILFLIKVYTISDIKKRFLK